MTTFCKRRSQLKRRIRMGNRLGDLSRLARRAARAADRCVATIDGSLRFVEASEARMAVIAAAVGGAR